MYYVYIIKSQDGHYFTGSTEDFQKRMLKHNPDSHQSRTSRFIDWKLVFFESIPYTYKRLELGTPN